jgi:hypothetical protein
MTEIEMTLPDFFYTEPRCRTSSPDFGKLKRATEVTPDTPGARLWLALCYYRVEAYATKKDRDAACGPTAYEDVQYFSASGKILAAAISRWTISHAGTQSMIRISTRS